MVRRRSRAGPGAILCLSGTCAQPATVWTDEVPQLRARPHHAPALARADADAAARLLEPAQPGGLHRPRPQGRRRRCEVFESVTRRYGKPAWGLRQTSVVGQPVPIQEEIVKSTAVLRPAPLRPRREGGRQALRPQGAGGGPDVRPLCHAAARHRRGDDPRAQSLRHRLARRARDPGLGSAASTSTTSSTTSSTSSAGSAPTPTSSPSASLRCRSWPPPRAWPPWTTRAARPRSP